MSRWIGRAIKVLTVIGGLYLFGWMLVEYARERVRFVRSACPTYECLVDVLKGNGFDRPGYVHDGVLSQIPKDVRDARYFYFAHSGYFEMRFPYSVDEFIAWAENLGWEHDAILANHHGVYLVLYDTDAPRGTESVESRAGYTLDSTGPREGATHKVIENMRVRTLAFDETSQIAYLILWTPLPQKLKNGWDIQVAQ